MALDEQVKETNAGSPVFLPEASPGHAMRDAGETEGERQESVGEGGARVRFA